MNANVVIEKANAFVKESELAAAKGQKVSSAKKNNFLTQLGSLFMKGIPFEGAFKKAYEELDKVTNIA